MKVFLSMPMGGKGEAEYNEEKERAYTFLVETLGRTDIEIISSFIPAAAGQENRNKQLHYLGQAISMMADAELALFMTGWSQGRGCIIENEVARQYNIPILVY